jgi:hypothetical protein
MSQLFLDILTLAVTTGTVLIYIHTFEATEAKRKVIETKRKEREDRMFDAFERRFSLIAKRS